MERIRPGSPVAQKITSEIATLIQEGCVLSVKDLDEIAVKHGVCSGTFIADRLGRVFGATISPWNNPQKVYDLSGIRMVKARYKRHILLAPIDLPLDQTEWAEVTSNIDTKLHEASIQAGQSGRISGKIYSRIRYVKSW